MLAATGGGTTKDPPESWGASCGGGVIALECRVEIAEANLTTPSRPPSIARGTLRVSRSISYKFSEGSVTNFLSRLKNCVYSEVRVESGSGGGGDGGGGGG